MKHLKFLLATDYSEAVMNAERYATQLAKATGSMLRLVHVYPVPIAFPSELMEYSRDGEEVHRSEAQRLEKHHDEIFQALNISPEELPCEYAVREGSNIGTEIREEGEESKSDFIIVGTHGVSGFRETFLGTHAWDVIRKSTIPVFAIPKDALFTGIKNIVFATSYREEEFYVLDFLVKLAKEFDAHLTVLHITNYVLSKEFETKMFDKFKSDVEEKFPYSRLEVRLLVHDAITEALNLYCSDTKTDILAMSIPKMTLFEKIFTPNLSLTKKMSIHTDIPFLAVPVSYAMADDTDKISKPSAAKEVKERRQ